MRVGSHNRNTLEMIYAIFDSIEPDEHGCHNYPAKPQTGGYCVVSINMKKHRVHRLALERKLGRPIRPGFDALHHCDNPPCVNEDHLYEGTDLDNAKDREERSPEYRAHIQRLVQIGLKARLEKYHRKLAERLVEEQQKSGCS